MTTIAKKEMSVEEFVDILPFKIGAGVPGADGYNQRLEALDRKFTKARDAFIMSGKITDYCAAEDAFRAECAVLKTMRSRLMREPSTANVGIIYKCLTLAKAGTPEAHRHNKTAMAFADAFTRAIRYPLAAKMRAHKAFWNDSDNDGKRVLFNIEAGKLEVIANTFLMRARQLEAARNRIDKTKQQTKKTDWKNRGIK